VAAPLLRAAGRLHHDETALKDSVAGWDAIGARFERACTLLLLPDRVDEGTPSSQHSVHPARRILVLSEARRHPQAEVFSRIF